MAFSKGTYVSGYRIESELGAGGMGTVYLAANPVLPRHDALKVLSEELSRDPSFRARFLREADLAATLNHPNIVTVYTRGETEDGQLWIAMQYVSGSDALKELREHRMTVQRALHIIGEVAKALDYAHRRNLVHRDVKPANFLLDPDGERVLLADFGIARALDDTEGLTLTGTVMATVAYAAPEALGVGRVDGRADIYALACSLYMLVTGATPFAKAGGMHAVMAAHLYQAPPPVTDTAPLLPEAINAVIARAMAKSPDDRYQSAREFAAAAVEALDGQTGAPSQFSERTIPTPAWVRQSATDHAVTYPSGSQPQTQYPIPQPPPQHHAMPPPARYPAQRRRRGPLLIATAIVGVVIAVGATALLWPRGEATAVWPQTFKHAHGSTEITAKPHSVAALGPGDADSVLALGVQPVLIVAPDATLPGWDRELVSENPRIIPSVDSAAIAAAGPDVIIDTEDLDGARYAALAQIAPTITRSANSAQWTWRDRLGWIGRVLGRQAAADELIRGADVRQSELRSAHPAFTGKVIEVVNVSDTGVSVALADSRIAGYLEGLDFRYAGGFDRAAADAGEVRALPDVAALSNAGVDVRVVVRTDKSGAGGSYNGLPQPLTQFQGATVIVDEPELVAAMNSGSYGALKYLDDALVSALARQVH